MSNVNTKRPLNADEITTGNVLKGDGNRPNRFGTGTKVTGVDHDHGWVIVRTDTNGTLQFMPWETLYVAIGQTLRFVDAAKIVPGDEVAEPGHRNGPFYRVLKTGVVSLVLHACPVGDRCMCPSPDQLVVRSLMKTHDPIIVRRVAAPR